MASKKHNKRRKTFSFPTDGPLYDSDDDWAVASPDGLLADQPEPEDSARPDQQLQLEMIRSVLAFDKLAWRGFKTILASILFFGVGTSLAGGVLGLAFPNYCRFIFGAFDRVDFKPWVGGLSHGLLLGALAGMLIGCVVVMSVAIYQSRSFKNIERDRQG